MFSPCKRKGSSSVSSSVTFHHSYTLLSGTVSKTKGASLVVSPPICCWPINLRVTKRLHQFLHLPTIVWSPEPRTNETKWERSSLASLQCLHQLCWVRHFFFKFPVHLAHKEGKIVILVSRGKKVFCFCCVSIKMKGGNIPHKA